MRIAAGMQSRGKTQRLTAMLDRFYAVRAQASLSDQLQTEFGRAAYQAIKDQLACIEAPKDSLCGFPAVLEEDAACAKNSPQCHFAAANDAKRWAA